MYPKPPGELWAPPLALGDTEADPGCLERRGLSPAPHDVKWSFLPGLIKVTYNHSPSHLVLFSPKKARCMWNLREFFLQIPLQILLGIGLLRRSMKLQVMCSKIT